ncbi:hypothetical protein N7462_006576 [Penicillium macrosclerotiorum]|uniref:uncharacterized protein n=1 Tax=Penicillium macrosclerotiorum TaxID=303699 RepID=UPI0025474030|nr:uncharacterized protein N7462_006576 [Penicillium macrosclerotiorum]KAJ5683411.1 hypothetical protein N7462_006576 [Penicillium macrosclerotiorum]
MAPFQGLARAARPGVLFVVLALLQCSFAQVCTFWDSGCIDPLAQTAVPIDFSPLFIDPVTFYYGFDSTASGKGGGPSTKTGFWLRYQDGRVNPDAITSNRTSEISLHLGNFTGTPSGTNNGCDGIWGTLCSLDIKNALKGSIFHLSASGIYYSKPLKAALTNLMLNPSRLPNCGAPVFDVPSIPVQGSGNRPWQVWYIDNMTSHKQASQVAVGILARSPVWGSPPPHTPDEVQIELVCLQAPSGPPTGPSKDHD